MQIKLFTIPVLEGEVILDELNVFLRSKKILQIEQKLSETQAGCYWCYSIKYLEDQKSWSPKKSKIDYKEVLGKSVFNALASYEKSESA